MKLRAEDDTTNGLLLRLTDGRVEMGLYPVLFGWRVRGGMVGDGWCHCDWCCGADPLVVFVGYNLMRRLLEGGVSLMELPGSSRIKPFNNDDEFVDKLQGLLERVGGYSPQEETAALGEQWDLGKLRREYMETHFKQ